MAARRRPATSRSPRCPTRCAHWRVKFGAVIVKRGRTFAGFTPEGERVLQSGRCLMLHERELLQQDLASVAGRPQGRLVIGVVPAAVPVAARFAAQLQALHPGIAPAVRSMSSPEMERGPLDDLTLDMGLGYTDRMGTGGCQAGPRAAIWRRATGWCGVRPNPRLRLQPPG